MENKLYSRDIVFTNEIIMNKEKKIFFPVIEILLVSAS